MDLSSIKIIPIESLPEKVELKGAPVKLSLPAEDVEKLRQIGKLGTLFAPDEPTEEHHLGI